MPSVLCGIRYSVPVLYIDLMSRLSLPCMAQPTSVIAVSAPFPLYRTLKPPYRTDVVPLDYEIYKSLERVLARESLPCGTPRTHCLLHARVLWLYSVSCDWAIEILSQIPDTISRRRNTVSREGKRIPLTVRIPRNKYTLPCYQYA